MKILLASSEAVPYSKTGGLADMVGALAKFLARGGNEVGLVTPLYPGIRESFPDIQPFDWRLDLPLGADRVSASVLVRRPEKGLTVYFIDHPGFYQRSGIYNEGGRDYADNAERFIFFCKAVVNLARYLPWRPQVIHAHDWPCGLLPALVREQKLSAGWADATPVCLTIHNLAYQGNFPGLKFALTNLPPSYFVPDGMEYYGLLNCLKAGIAYADHLTTVSPRYAREITTELYGCGLDDMLRRRQSVLSGILNGVDYEEWNTTSNQNLPFPYAADDLAGKERDKLALQKELGLPQTPDIPLFGSVTRLADQKGMDLQLGALEEMLAADMQFVVLGSGSREYERGFRRLAERHPKKCRAHIGFDSGLSHRIEAASDFYLMPSRFEPCGLNQLYSLRYGAVPIVRLTGGLDDTVVDITEKPDRADGIKFSEYSVRALAKAVRKALALYADKDLLTFYRQNGMAMDFSWERTALTYAKLYERMRAL